MRRSDVLVVALTASLLCIDGCDQDPPLPAVPASPASLPAPPLSRDGAATMPAIKPPHGGHLLTMPEGRGYVEWVVDAGQLYFLDAAAGPARGAENVVLTIQSDGGPRQIDLTACRDETFDGACWTHSAAELRDERLSAVLRFQLEGRPVRVVLGVKAPMLPVEDPLPRPAERLLNQ